ncbi:MAG TPA: GNAT family N-acetyltransferase [Candidatus Saccharimonadales bacterium]|nr:GNAT family N-acetyltransferase [Candidatus Saccharimonadales bacterium]
MAEKLIIDPQNVLLVTDWINDRLLVINGEHGYLNGSYDPPSRLFYIGDLFVTPKVRRQGMGKRLLEAARQEAVKKGARLIASVITKREQLDAMTSVFGEESIEVKQLGQYENPNPDASDLPTSQTSAVLSYKID